MLWSKQRILKCLNNSILPLQGLSGFPCVSHVLITDITQVYMECMWCKNSPLFVMHSRTNAWYLFLSPPLPPSLSQALLSHSLITSTSILASPHLRPPYNCTPFFHCNTCTHTYTHPIIHVYPILINVFARSVLVSMTTNQDSRWMQTRLYYDDNIPYKAGRSD